MRYGELALKSAPVRREFERTLQRNILDQFAAAGLACRLRADAGHLYVEAEAAEPAVRLIRRVFGVTSVSEVIEVPADPATIIAESLRMVDPLLTEGRRFAIRARRTGQHPFTSQQLAGEVGGAVLERFRERAPKVDLDHPEVELFIEVRDRRAYLSTGREAGPGGLPLGVAGRVIALVDGHRGALGAYLLMKRGCRCGLVPTADASTLATEVLRRFDPKVAIADPARDRIAAGDELRRLADAAKADGIVLPLTIDDYPDAKAQWGDRVVFSPTVGLTDEEVASRWLAVEHLAA